MLRYVFTENLMVLGTASAKIEFKQWDTEHFGFKCYEIRNICGEVDDAERLLNEYIDRTDAYFITLRIRKNHPFVEKLPSVFTLMENQNIYQREIIPQKHLVDENKEFVILFKKEEIDNELLSSIRNLAGRTFFTSRFYKDKRFERYKVNQLYSDWVANHIQNINGLDNMLFDVFLKNGLLAGFHTYKYAGGYGRTVLISVNDTARNQGLGKYMIRQAWTRTKAMIWEYGTQSENASAIKMLEGLSFKLVDQRSIYHLWKEKKL